ncbi:AmmeMemoRadiSam system protein A, partial [bacterium]|nr:AmmeMemoRadiSam system protein A [bacterium]
MSSVYVRIAEDTIENYIKHGKVIDLPDYVEQEFFDKKAGVFVSIHMNSGELRGCIGTISPTQKNVVLEIMHNAISASTRDPRFPEITSEELDDLVINVDILTEPQKVQDRSELDPKKFGIIVESGFKRGLLLPDLDGVDDVETQINISCRK